MNRKSRGSRGRGKEWKDRATPATVEAGDKKGATVSREGGMGG